MPKNNRRNTQDRRGSARRTKGSKRAPTVSELKGRARRTSTSHPDVLKAALIVGEIPRPQIHEFVLACRRNTGEPIREVLIDLDWFGGPAVIQRYNGLNPGYWLQYLPRMQIPGGLGGEASWVLGLQSQLYRKHRVRLDNVVGVLVADFPSLLLDLRLELFAKRQDDMIFEVA